MNVDDLNIVQLRGRWFVTSDGRVRPLIRGGSDPVDPPDPDDPDDDDPDDPPDPGKQFSQADLDAAVQRRLDKAKRAERRRLEEELGMTAAEAKAVLDEVDEKDQERLSEAERREAAAARREAEAEAREAKATERLRTTNVRAALRDAGVPATKLKRVERLVDLDDDVDPEDEDEIAAAVEALKGEMPELFGTTTSDDDPPPPAPDGDPPSTGPGGPRPRNRKGASARGAERARALQGKAPTPA